ncbi:TetR/AcrR family transcriptional regulator [Streptomyces mutabilis]|uniref:TetR/AcrR family transcriptional regulator n=1 Tax=Streptomyces mutabilis TaxID=67332 RepID=UPI0036A04828
MATTVMSAPAQRRLNGWRWNGRELRRGQLRLLLAAGFASVAYLSLRDALTLDAGIVTGRGADVVVARTGRPREFDKEQTLERALKLFWSRGYGATSIQDLVDALSVERGSLYGTFGDKRRFYLEAVSSTGRCTSGV